MRVLATGITGFAGHHLAPLLIGAGHEVLAILRDDIAETPPPGVDGVPIDITDPDQVRAFVRSVAPEGVVHLAGMSSVGESFGAPVETWKVNLWGTLAILEALRCEAPNARGIAVTSGEIYGSVPLEDLPVTPDTPLRPLSPYGASKAAADLCVAQYRAGFGLPIMRVRAFNHIGPGQDARFVVPSVAQQIARAETREAEIEIHVGNVDTRRDFTDVRDMMRAYVALLERGDPDTAYVACSGRSRSIRELIDGLVAHARIPTRIVVDEGRRRDGEQPDLYGDATLLREHTGWEPEIPIEQTLADTLDYWRQREAAT